MFFKGTEQRFNAILKEHIVNTVLCAEELLMLFSDTDKVEARIQHILELEHKNDLLAAEFHQLLDKAYITRFDKSDMYRMIEEQDNITDFIQKAALSRKIYKIVYIRPEAKFFSQIILEMVKILQDNIASLPNLKLVSTHAMAIKIRELEGRADVLLQESLERLMLENDCKMIIVWKELYERLEEVSDRCEDVADVILSIARKESR